ncbi:MAG: hypothetical protein LBS03_11285 [Bacteroidales bacterium]|jgi:hypothetical protein|nr:hypothetical protein [Bacteroidales bacterium]
MINEELPEYLHNDNPFTVPEEYFDDFQKKMMHRIRETKKPFIRPIGYLKYAVAASLLLLSMTLLLLRNRPTADLPDEQLADAVLTWAYQLDKTAWMAAVLDMDETGSTDYCCTEEQETEIIYFLASQDIPIETLMQSMKEE